MEPIRSGTILAQRYVIGEVLGSGGFGATYRAVDKARFGATCVVKELLPARTSNETAKRLFEREARLLSELNHPQIPTLHAYLEEGGKFYLVQDYVEGETLAHLLERETRVSETFARSIVLSLLNVLEYLHGRSPAVIHRDIKPANIIVGKNGTIYLIDFGAVREAIGSDDQQTVIGTPGYTPREQAVGRPRPSSDLYALGATALEMITGLHPLEWHDHSSGQLNWRGRVSCSDQFEEVLASMLADAPMRFRTAEAARDALLGSSSEGAHREVSMEPPRREPLPVPVSAAAPAVADHHAKVSVPNAGSEKSDVIGSAAQGNTHKRDWIRTSMIGVVVASLAVIVWSVSQRAPASPSADPASSVGSPQGQVSAPSSPTVAADTQTYRPTVEMPPPTAPRDVIDTSGFRPLTPEDEQGPLPKSSSAPPSVKPEATPEQRAECARLLERASLGERLSQAETTKLRQQCSK